MGSQPLNPWVAVPIEQLDEIVAAIEYRLGDLECRMYGYNEHVGAVLLSIYEHYPGLLLGGESLEETRERIAKLNSSYAGGSRRLLSSVVDRVLSDSEDVRIVVELRRRSPGLTVRR
jgi:hypothetical protein